jgi:hypothetical protein
MAIARTDIEHQPGRGQMAQDSGLMHYVGGAQATEEVHAARAIDQTDLKFVVRLGLPHLLAPPVWPHIGADRSALGAHHHRSTF